MLQAGRSRVRFLIRVLDFSVDLIIPRHYGPGVGSASNTEMSTKNILGDKGRAELKADLTAICEPIV
jgi:hypothetical protein